MTVRILQGDVREKLKDLPADSFDCICTSPPYWGLRDYGTAKWEGGSDVCDHKSPSRFDYTLNSALGSTGVQSQASNAGSGSIKQFLDVCGKCGARRIDNQIGLEPTLTEYLDTMVAVCRELRRVMKPSGTFWLNVGDSYANKPIGSFNGGGFKDSSARTGGRDLSGVATSGVADKLAGSGLKPKDLCMVPNRLAIRLQEDGWYVRSEIIWHKPNPMPESVTDRPTSSHEKIWLLTKSERYAYDADAIAEPSIWSPGTAENVLTGGFQGKRTDSGYQEAFRAIKETRNARNVWTIATQPYSEAHFATFPPELAERCIKAGCPVGGHVLDPFGGSGTTGVVADRLGRDATIIELNPAYVTLIKNRIAEDAGMFAQVAAE